jgi:type IV pilus assembly protein PilV
MRFLPTQSLPRCRQFRPVQHRHSQLGVALIEALVSILIFSFGVLGLIGLEASAIRFSVDAEDRNRAALIANEIASNMWLSNSVTVSAAQLTVWKTAIAEPTNGGLPNGSLTITPTGGPTRSADIALTWKAPSDPTGSPDRQFTTRVILP